MIGKRSRQKSRAARIFAPARPARQQGTRHAARRWPPRAIAATSGSTGRPSTHAPKGVRFRRTIRSAFPMCRSRGRQSRARRSGPSPASGRDCAGRRQRRGGSARPKSRPGRTRRSLSTSVDDVAIAESRYVEARDRFRSRPGGSCLRAAHPWSGSRVAIRHTNGHGQGSRECRRA